MEQADCHSRADFSSFTRYEWFERFENSNNIIQQHKSTHLECACQSDVCFSLKLLICIKLRSRNEVETIIYLIKSAVDVGGERTSDLNALREQNRDKCKFSGVTLLNTEKIWSHSLREQNINGIFSGCDKSLDSDRFVFWLLAIT